MRRLPHFVLDDFLPAGLHHRLLHYALTQEHSFEPAAVYGADNAEIEVAIRHSLHCTAGLGALKSEFEVQITARTAAIFEALGMAPFAVAKRELQLSAHGHGGFYRPHIDTVRAAIDQRSDRLVTIVYYLHTMPRCFRGGDLAIFPITQGEPEILEPRDNRLVAFPSFAKHEVRPIFCNDPQDFSQYRFSINCWLHRSR